ncbi:adenosine deaminase [Clostridium sp. FP1]|uniref:adenosine deaminase n=1 Tax=Clostridium sp. FP1 TaxID=2724076 RepID=UPI001CCF9EB9|nr:adenosine deaminase [Clostridium sp. FP1]MBZ9635206.1 adenosine deaminase [Clostridium sp. FP1]
MDVHNHCGLGMRFSTFNKWAGGNVSEPPKKIDGIIGIDNYIFYETLKFISKEEDIAFLIEETVKEAIEDGVKVLESSIDCHNLKYFTSNNNFFNTILSIRDKYNKSIDLRLEVGMSKSISNEDLNEMLIPCIDSGVFKAIDLYGDETRDDFERFKEYYKYAKNKGLKLKAHAGEFQGAENVKKVIEILEVDEIQHGIGVASSEYVMDLIKERNIRLNICPSSNYILGAVKNMINHPARKLFDKGLTITINTDDLLLFNSGVSEEYLYLYNLGLFNEDELNEIRKLSLA